MVQSDLETEKIENVEGQSQRLGIPRVPSFSLWCDEDGIDDVHHHLYKANESAEDSDFELPFLEQGNLENNILNWEGSQYSKAQQTMQLNGGQNMEGLSIPVREHGTEKYAPFDIENTSKREMQLSNDGINDSSSIKNIESSSLSAVDVLKTLFFIFVWFSFSTLLTMYNKTLLGDDLGKFPAPLLMNTVHFAMQAIISNVITWYWSNRFRPSVNMSWRDYSIRVVPTAVATALDVNLSNASLVFISVTFATMCKSASPIFLLLFAFAFRLESPSVKLLGIILVISVGVLLTVAKETEFEFWGFIFVMMAAVMSGFRWTMTQILLQKEAYGLKNPLTLMSYVTPVMAVATALLSLIFDPWYEFRSNDYFNSSRNIARSCLLMLFGGTLAFLMVLTEYVLISITSAVTVTIAGVVKEAVTILVAVFYFHDEFTWLKGVGLFTIMIGVSLFNWYKYDKLHKGRSEDEIEGPSLNVAAKYVILEEVDDLADGT